MSDRTTATASNPVAVLVVEYDGGSTIAARLAGHGYQVASAAPQEALVAAERGQPRAIIVVVKGDMASANRLCRDLVDNLRSSPIIIVAPRSPANVAAAFAAGAADFVGPEVDEAELVARIAARTSAAPRRKIVEALFTAELEVTRDGHFRGADDDMLAHFYPARLTATGPTTITELWPESLARPVMKAIDRAAQTGAYSIVPLRVARDRWLEISVVAISEQRFALIARDVTERLMAEEARLAVERKLRRDDKMTSIARLAAGASNDVRNVIGAIMSFATNLRADVGEDGRWSESLDRIGEACWRGADLARELATIAGEPHFAAESVAVNGAIIEVTDLLAQAIPATIEVETNLAEGQAAALGGAAQITELITILALSAIDSMPDGGKLSFATEVRPLTPGELESHCELAPGNYVVLTISDTGRGMDPAAISHAFEPFYSDRSGDGSRLALPMAYGLVRSQRGAIQLDSELGGGTTIAIFLPRFEPGAARVRAETQPSTAPRGRTILAIDDEDLIRESFRMLLRRLGYPVILARNGAEGLAALAEHGEEIGLVILDLIMPGLSGAETFAKIRALDPLAPILVCSGCAGETSAADLLEEGAEAFLAKPFTLDGLRQALAETSITPGA